VLKSLNMFDFECSLAGGNIEVSMSLARKISYFKSSKCLFIGRAKHVNPQGTSAYVLESQLEHSLGVVLAVRHDKKYGGALKNIRENVEGPLSLSRFVIHDGMSRMDCIHLLRDEFSLDQPILDFADAFCFTS
jgi:hypothetical protein